MLACGVNSGGGGCGRPLLEAPFSPAEPRAHRVSEVTKVIKAG